MTAEEIERLRQMAAQAQGMVNLLMAVIRPGSTIMITDRELKDAKERGEGLQIGQMEGATVLIVPLKATAKNSPYAHLIQ